MRRSGVILMVLALAGCDAMKDAFSARPETVARAGDQTLGVERIAQWAGPSKIIPLQQEALSRLAHVWVDLSLFGEQLAAGQSLNDSATTLAAMWPIVSQMKWERFHDRLVAARSALTAAQVDSAYQAGGARLFQHILLQVPQSAAPPVVDQKRRQLEGLRRQIGTSGARFGAVASQYSEDQQSKIDHGLLPVAERGAYVQPFEDSAWALAPGAVSGVIRTAFGFHIIRRPLLAEVRDSFKVGLENRLAVRFDSLYLDSLSQMKKLTVVDGAPAKVRSALQDVDAAKRSGTTLVKYRGGAFRTRDLIRWIYSLDPSVAGQIGGATDEQLTQFLRVISQRQLLLAQADSAGVQLTPDDWTYLKTQHDSALVILETVLNLNPQQLKDSLPTPAARAAAAATHVDQYLERVISGRAQFIPVPPFLAEVLRQRVSWSVNEAGVRRALERAKALRAAVDSSRTPGAPSAGPTAGQPPAITPAPGPAPAPRRP